MRYPAESYGSIAQVFHWLIAVLVFVQIGIGVYVDDLPVSIERLQWLSLHKSLGFIILLLVLLRLAWRLFHPAPPFPASMSRFAGYIAKATHVLLYVLLIAAPIAGWLHASASGLGVNVFGWFVLPDIVPKSKELSELFRLLHGALVKVLAAVIVLHIAAALRHALLLRDEVMARMLPWKSRKRRRA